MGNNTSPLETLAAFAIVFVAGALSVIGAKAYAERVRSETQHSNKHTPPD